MRQSRAPKGSERRSRDAAQVRRQLLNHTGRLHRCSGGRLRSLPRVAQQAGNGRLGASAPGGAVASGCEAPSRDGAHCGPWRPGEQGARPRGSEPEVPGTDRCEHERARRSVMNQALPGRWQSSSRGRHRQASSDHRTVPVAHVGKGQPETKVTAGGGDEQRTCGDAAHRCRGKQERGHAERGQRRTLAFIHRKRWSGASAVDSSDLW